MSIMIKKRNGRKEILDITKIQKHTIAATDGLDGVSQSELEIDAQIKFIDGMSSSRHSRCFDKNCCRKN
jgi:ribonucleoside-diphosphate reductase alpha chain